MIRSFIAFLFILVLVQNCDFRFDKKGELVYDGLMCFIDKGVQDEKFIIPYNPLQYPR